MEGSRTYHNIAGRGVVGARGWKTRPRPGPQGEKALSPPSKDNNERRNSLIGHVDRIGGAELTSVCLRLVVLFDGSDAVIATFGIDISRVGNGGGARIGGRRNASQQDNFNFDVAVTSGGLVVDECYFCCKEGVRILSAALAIHFPPVSKQL